MMFFNLCNSRLRSGKINRATDKIPSKRNKFFLVVIVFLLAFSSYANAQKKSQKGAKKPAVQNTKTQKKPSAQKTKIKEPVKKSAQKTKAKEPSKKTESKIERSTATTSPGDASADEKKVRDMVEFLQFVLNTLGSNSTPTRDKDVLIKESYSKIFRDSKVQIEDDLDEDRDVITNKDVVAYLKDVDFFFNDVKFEFVIGNIKSNTMPNGQLFYKVSLSRNLTGTTAEGTQVNNTLPRFIEINYNPDDQDLKIVSIYTNEFNEKEALTNWWKELSYEWQNIFRKKLNLADSVQLNDIKNITAIEDLDLSNNKYIQNIEPLAQLINLKLLNLSGTNVNDLTPIRNLTELIELNLSHTKVQDLLPLKYSDKIIRLNIDHTQVRDISVLEKMTALQNLEMNHTPVIDFASISNLNKLVNLDLASTQISNLSSFENLVLLIELNLSTTPIEDLNPLKGLKTLNTLNIDSTRIKDLGPLSGAENLKVLHANYTLIGDLQPLQKLPRLEKIYCDHTSITKDKADAFAVANPKVLIIFDTKDLKSWWDGLPQEWKSILSKTAKISLTPVKEELAKITSVDSLNLSGNISIRDLEPIRKLQKIKALVADKTGIRDLLPLQDLLEIRYLNISETEITDLSPISRFTKLKVLIADGTKVQSIEALYDLKSLKKLYVDHTAVVDINAKEFLEKNPGSLIIYKTVHLNRWWSTLSKNWKDLLRRQMGSDTTATRENLHKLIELEALHLKESPIHDLSGLTEFVRLKELYLSETSINDIPPLENIKSLKSLSVTRSPLQHIEALAQFHELEDLDFSNTPVDDLRPISNLENLKRLNCSGTQIKKLDALEKIQNLESLDCSNTKVANLNPVFYLRLKSLKCYNTKVSQREVEKFMEINKECNVVYYR